MTRILTPRTSHVRGWVGPLVEDAEPDKIRGKGALDDGQNWTIGQNGLRVVRGGSQVVQTLSAVAGNAISDVLGGWPYAPAGACVIGHSAAASKHYAYGMTTDMAFVTGVEATSRVDLGWNGATPGRPQAVELWEKLYVVDGRESVSRYRMAVLTYSGGVWTVANPTYDLDPSGGAAAGIQGYCVEAFAGVLLVASYDSETAADAPHILRQSVLSLDPSSAGGFESTGYVILGAKGQRIQAMRSGRTICLVAKANELYAISGAGRALPGWQLQVQQIGGTKGAGCTNGQALDHALGTWYGVGQSGPWRSDGATVDPLLSPRKRSWDRLANLELAVVRYHPERQQVLFGFYRPGLPAAYTQAVTDWWKWDIQREQWDLTDRYARSFHQVQAITITPPLPAVPPSSVVQSFSFGDFQWRNADIAITAYAWAKFTAGDAFAQTEVWGKSPTGSYALMETLPAGVSRFGIDCYALTSNSIGVPIMVKLRHLKGGVYSDYSAEFTLYPALPPPGVYPTVISGTATLQPKRISVSPFGGDTGDIHLISDQTYSKDWLGVVGTQFDTDAIAAPIGHQYLAYWEHLEWPVGHTQSVIQESCVDNMPGALSRPSQFMGSQFAETSAVIFYTPAPQDIMVALGGATAIVLEYRVFGSGSGWTTITTINPVYPPGSYPGTQIVVMTGLTHGTKYEVRARKNSVGGAVSGSAAVYTKLKAPTSVVATTNGTPGTPVVNVAVTMPTAGRDVRVYNALETYNQLFAAHGVGPTTHVSNVGICGTGDRYYASTYDSTWPAGYQFSEPVSDDVTDPCTVGS